MVYSVILSMMYYCYVRKKHAMYKIDHYIVVSAMHLMALTVDNDYRFLRLKVGHAGCTMPASGGGRVTLTGLIVN